MIGLSRQVCLGKGECAWEALLENDPERDGVVEWVER
jgi:hypothetical protein